MSGPERMGVDLPTGEHASPRQRHCPGACLRVTRDDYLALRRDGQLWATGDKDIAWEGRSDARAFCSNDVKERHVGSMVYYDALCGSCSELERMNRADLAARASR